ncbi:vinculin-like isoform X2 [Anticarsia gemmatalis]|uniref:vinculin-like isoform X1 n=1 Tax=Anticarsia gemmatalis TaxID=129554 RepID=UPI003F774272
MPDWKDTTAKILRATEQVESVLGGETIFKKQPEPNQPIYNEALNLHVAIRDWSSRDNEIVAVAKRMAVLMAKLSDYMNTDKQHEVLTTSKSIVTESHEVARLAKKLAHECSDHRIKTNLLQVCERIPTISGQLKMLTTVKGSSLGQRGAASPEDKEAMDMLVGNAQSLMISISDVVKAAASASVKIMSQRGPRIKWVRKTYY